MKEKELIRISTFYLMLLVAAVIFVCIAGSRLSGKIGVPTLFIFIALGMIFGSDGIFKIQFDNFHFAEQICSVALVFIMFYGGFGTRWSEARPVAGKSLLLSSAGVVLTAILTGTFCHLVLKMEVLEGLLLGAVLGSTDAASVFSILRSRKLNLKYGSASMLELESGSNDPFAYMMTLIILSAMSGETDGAAILHMLFLQLFVGILVGAAIAWLSAWVLNRVEFSGEGFDTIFVFATALISYGLSGVLGGNGYLSTYLTGIIMGNRELKNQKSLVGFFDAFTGMMQMLLFFLLGLLAFPSQMPAILLPALFIALFLTFVARPAAVGILLAPFRPHLGQYLVVSWAGLRGAASIVFAITATVSESYMKNDIFHIVFCVALFSIIFQGSLLPVIARKCRMIDDKTDVMKTFSDYTENMQIQFIQIPIGGAHAWANKKICDIPLMGGMRIVVIRRDGLTIVPRGQTVILEGDTVVLGAEGFVDSRDIQLKEIVITPEHRWCGKQICEAKFYKNTIIVMIKRGSQTLIPDGNTEIREGDHVVVYSQKFLQEAPIGT